MIKNIHYGKQRKKTASTLMALEQGIINKKPLPSHIILKVYLNMIEFKTSYNNFHAKSD